MLVCEIKGNRVKIRHLKYEDVVAMKNWGKHDDPLFKDYNFPNLSEEEMLSWYNYRTSRKDSKCFSVFNEENRMIGYINLRNIRKIMRTARLGIVFDPAVLNQGYGTDALRTAIDYFFNVLNLNTIFLDVAKFNKRAIRCYEKCGFKKIREYQARHSSLKEEKYDSDSYVWYDEFFTIKNDIVYCKYYEMKIQKK